MSKKGALEGAFPFLALAALGQHFGEAADSAGNEPRVATGKVTAAHLPSVNICEIHQPLMHPWAERGLYTPPTRGTKCRKFSVENQANWGFYSYLQLRELAHH